MSQINREHFFSNHALVGYGLLVLLALGAPLVSAQPNTEPGTKETMEYRYWDWGVTPKRDDYQVQLLRLALDKTRSSHGAFKILRVKAEFSTPRVRRELSRGKIINVQVGPWRRVSQSVGRSADPAMRIDIPLYKGLLGYRHLIVRSEDQARFAAITQVSALKRLVAGQVRGWVDTDVYRANGYQVQDSSNISNVLAMLNAKRYDYVPMSIVEAPLLLESQAERGYKMVVAQRPLLYFPLPFVFYVSIHESELARRLEEGLRIAQSDGSFDELFTRTFAAEIALIKQQQGDYFVLHNPLLPAHLQKVPSFLD